jgi:uncharacterized protein YxjI
MDLDALQQQTTLLVRQKLTAFVNRYVISLPGPDGGDGELVAFVEQKRLAFREEVTFFADEAKTTPLFRFKARQILDLGATYDVTAMDGSPIGTFRKDFKKSLLRSTWHLEQPMPDGQLLAAVGRERSTFIAVLRRVWDLAENLPFPFKYHFDFVAAEKPVMSVDKTALIRDRYRVEISEPGLDRRLAIAMAVALDALQSR